MATTVDLGSGNSLHLVDMQSIFDDAQRMRMNDQQMKQSAYAQQRQVIADQRADQQYDTNNAAGQQYYGGDATGARKTAIAGNDFELVDKLDAKGREDAARMATTGGSIAFDLAQTPADQRAALFAAHAPAMKAAGFSDQQIAQYGTDLSDATLAQHLGDAQTLADKLAQKNKDDKIQDIGGYGVRQDGSIAFQPPYIQLHNADGSTSMQPNPLYRGDGAGGQAATTAAIANPDPVLSQDGDFAANHRGYSRANIAGSESNGNDAARNSHGSAAGRYQFTAPTALSLIQQNPSRFPETRGMTPQQVVDFAQAPAVQERMMDISEPQYRSALASVGAPATGQNMYMMHFLGTGTGPKFLTMNTATNARQAIYQLDPKHAAAIISGNGAIFGPNSTVGSVQAEMGRRYNLHAGGGSGGDGFSHAAPAAPQSAAPAPGHTGLPTLSGQGLGYGPNGSGSGFDPQALDDATSQYIINRSMPPVGMGKEGAAMRQAILNNVPKMLANNGLTMNDIPRIQSEHKANQSTLSQLQRQREIAAGAEDTALANGKVFLDQSAQIPLQTRFPFVNSLTQGVMRNMGSTSVQGSDSSYNTFLTEYAKVATASPSGSGNLTDSARHENMETLRGNAAPAQKQRAYDVLHADMDNRMAALDKQIERMQDADTRLLIPHQRGQAAPAQTAPAQHGQGIVAVTTPAQAMSLPPGTRFRTPDGRLKIR